MHRVHTSFKNINNLLKSNELINISRPSDPLFEYTNGSKIET
jgi:hypothetical protein